MTKVSFVDRSSSRSEGASVAVEHTAGRRTEASAFELEGEETAALEALFDEGE